MPCSARLVLALSLSVMVTACEDDDDSVTGPEGARYAVAYLNPDLGLLSGNPDVPSDSDCDTPDQEDTQRLSDALGNRSVHVDACLSSRPGGAGAREDVQASFEVSGVGNIVACPDPDGNGPKTAVVVGNRCTQSGFQSRRQLGDNEYHVRVNNSTTTGEQIVTFCYDPEGDGCHNASSRSRSRVRIDWIR